MIFYLVDALIVFAVLLVLFSQVVTPLIYGTSLFPFFNDVINDAQTALQIEKERLEVAKIEADAAAIAIKTAMVNSSVTNINKNSQHLITPKPKSKVNKPADESVNAVTPINKPKAIKPNKPKPKPLVTDKVTTPVEPKVVGIKKSRRPRGPRKSGPPTTQTS